MLMNFTHICDFIEAFLSILVKWNEQPDLRRRGWERVDKLQNMTM